MDYVTECLNSQYNASLKNSLVIIPLEFWLVRHGTNQLLLGYF